MASSPVQRWTSLRKSAAGARRRLGALALGHGGAIVVEAVLALLVFGMVGTAVLSGLSTLHLSGASIERQSTAENIARNQMEYLFSLPYQPPPASCPLVAVPEGYSLTCYIEEYVIGDPNIARLVVTVSFSGAELLTLETLRSN